jgi:melibiose permease/lactose/raffinose/galactose permease
MYLLIYIQYTGLVNAAQFLVLTAIIVLCRVWDAVNDPMMGTIISNTKTRFGKYRPWVLIGCLSNALFLILLFTLRFDNGWTNVAVLGVLYLLWGMTFTMNDVSYWSLLPALSEDKKDRDKLTSMVAIFASIGAFVAAGLVPTFTTGNAVMGYRIFAIVFTSIFVICQLLVFFLTHDNKQDKFRLTKEELDNEPKEKTVTIKDMVKILFRNKQLLVMALVVLLYTTASGFLIAFGQNFFYFKFGYDGTRVFIFTVIYAVGTLASQSLFPILTEKFSRNQIVKVSIFITILGYALFFIIANLPIDPSLCFILLCIFGILVFGGQGVFYMAMLVMLTNTIEYDEWKTGERNEAVTFSVRPFMVKLSGAIQAGIVSIALILCGLYEYTQQVGDLEILKNQDGSTMTQEELLNQATNILSKANDTQLFGLSIAMTIIPILLFVATYFIIKKKYIIDEALYDQMTKEIEERKNNQ